MNTNDNSSILVCSQGTRMYKQLIDANSMI